MNTMTFSKKAKYMALGAIMSTFIVVIPPSFAGPDHVLRNEFQTFVNTTFANFQKAVFEQVKSIYSNMKDAFGAQMEAMYKIAEFENTINSAISNAAGQLMNQTTGAIQNSEVGKALQQAGIDIQQVSQGTGKTPVNTTNTQISNAANNVTIKNPLDAITYQTVIMLQNQAKNRLNVLSFLDSKPNSANCKSVSADKCTILVTLREQEAIAFAEIHNRAVPQMFGTMLASDKPARILQQVYANAKITNNVTGPAELYSVLKYLTLPNAPALGFDKGVASPDTNKANLLVDVIAGSKNDTQILTRAAMSSLGRDNQQQLDAFSKIAKVQLARSAILNAHSDAMHASLNAQFRACVGRPDVIDQVGSSQEQHLVNIQALLRCNNLMMLQHRQQESENQRMQAAILLTLLDIYGVNAPR